MLADKVMIADVQLVQRLPERGDDARMAVTQVEHAAIAVAVNETAFARRVPYVNALAFAENEINANLRKELGLAARDMAGKPLDDFLFGVLTDQ